MIINRSHLPWAFLVAAATLLLSVTYLELFRPGSTPHYLPVPVSLGTRPFGHRSVGATPLGIAYGTAAYLIFIFAALLGVRKKVRHWRIGRAESWMRAHIWLTILTIPLVLFHCGFHSGSIMTTSLMVLYVVVMASGFYGLALQQFLPRQMMDVLPHEVIYDQIPYLRALLVESATALRNELDPRPLAGVVGTRPESAFKSSASGPVVAIEDPKAQECIATLREMLEQEVLPYLKARKGSRRRLARRQVSDNLFRIVRVSVSEEYHAKVDAMQKWCDERRQMDIQMTMQNWLHYWLLVHVPTSLLLLIWTGWHALTALYYF
jgi:hypothetical protein